MISVEQPQLALDETPPRSRGGSTGAADRPLRSTGHRPHCSRWKTVTKPPAVPARPPNAMSSWRTGRFFPAPSALTCTHSVFPAQRLPSTAQRLVIAQWRQLCEARHCTPDYPIIAIRYQQGRSKLPGRTIRAATFCFKAIKLPGPVAGFCFVVKFDAVRGNVTPRSIARRSWTMPGPTLFAPQSPVIPHPVSSTSRLDSIAMPCTDPPWTHVR